jgi:hypothetical protein
VYIPPQVDTKTAIKELHWTLCKLETLYPEAAFIVAGDFNKANLRRLLQGLQTITDYKKKTSPIAYVLLPNILNNFFARF